MNVHVKNFNSPRVSKKVLELLSKLSKFTGYKNIYKSALFYVLSTIKIQSKTWQNMKKV